MCDSFEEIHDMLNKGKNPTEPENGHVIIPSLRSANAGKVENDLGLHAFIEHKIAGKGNGMDDN